MKKIIIAFFMYNVALLCAANPRSNLDEVEYHPLENSDVSSSSSCDVIQEFIDALKSVTSEDLDTLKSLIRVAVNKDPHLPTSIFESYFDSTHLPDTVKHVMRVFMKISGVTQEQRIAVAQDEDAAKVLRVFHDYCLSLAYLSKRIKTDAGIDIPKELNFVVSENPELQNIRTLYQKEIRSLGRMSSANYVVLGLGIIGLWILNQKDCISDKENISYLQMLILLGSICNTLYNCCCLNIHR